jgi:hypothetical protein
MRRDSAGNRKKDLALKYPPWTPERVPLLVRLELILHISRQSADLHHDITAIQTEG